MKKNLTALVFLLSLCSCDFICPDPEDGKEKVLLADSTKTSLKVQVLDAVKP
jgi:hypothetical protein